MLKSHEKFHSAYGKRQVLVADDEIINRELLEMVLREDYDVIMAADGQEALQLIRENRSTLSIILLDLMMPVMNGLDLLVLLKDDPGLQNIPVIVLTSDQESEIRSLELGAADFIPKPYPQPGVIQARVRRTIELFEDRATIQTTERDPLTSLYNREYFYHYADLFDQYHKETPMDAIVIDVQHFHIINERFGSAYGNEVLQRIAGKLRELAAGSDGIVCRRDADIFMVYCPHGSDPKAILESASVGLSGDDMAANRIRLRMGVYAEADKSIPIERRFDRADRARNTIRGSYTQNIAYYNNELHEKEIFNDQLVEDYHTAIREKQFRVYYQPKFDIRRGTPRLSSAEALIRWIHPEFGFISPGTFIPLFEANGLIQELDHFVWKTAAEQIREWKDRFGFAIPVSVNVSRVDMYDADLVYKLDTILRENRLEPADLHLEVTESAYTEDSAQIIETVNRLRSVGFHIEMDDFGTGYSSLNMLSTLPIDTLKLDMQFIRNAFTQRKDTRLLEIIIDIADYLKVPVIAEGVETEEQLLALKAIGCDLVQGYYFSKPVPSKDFEPFLRERIAMEVPGEPEAGEFSLLELRSNTFGRIAHALSSGFETIYYVDINNDHYVELSPDDSYEALKIERTGTSFFSDFHNFITGQVYLPDQAQVLLCLRKKALLSLLNGPQPFSMTYRLMEEDKPRYYNLKAVRASSHDDHHIVIGVSNIDEQMRREEEQAIARQKANQDQLTGVKSLQASMEAEIKLNREIDEGIAQQFAVVLCDINDMTAINEAFGREEGDEYIKDACRVICNVFSHSPVYRVGGDEFAAVLQNNDYKQRMDLVRQIAEMNEAEDRDREYLLACGISEFRAGEDGTYQDVFSRAEAAMLENKKTLKAKTSR